MTGRDLRALIHVLGLSAASIALAFGVGFANAEQIHWPWQGRSYRQVPSHRPAATYQSREPAQVVRPATTADPSYRSVTPSEPPYRPAVTQSPPSQVTTPNQVSTPSRASTPGQVTAPMPQPSQYRPVPQPVAPQPVQSSAPPVAAQPVVAEPQRKPQPITSSAASAQAAAACMNERRSASVETAIKSCDSVIDETLKNLANAYYFRASARFGKRDFDGAIGDYGQALRLDPSDADYLSSRAAAYEAKNEVDKALADYGQAIKANPSSPLAYSGRGAIYQKKGDYLRAAADYGEVTRLQPNNIDAWSARCWVRALSSGQTQMALGDCNAALKIKPDAPDVLDTRGFVYLKLGQTDNAIKDYDAALKLDPKLAGSLYGRGIARMRKGDRNGSSEDIAQARAVKADIAEEFARYGLRP